MTEKESPKNHEKGQKRTSPYKMFAIIGSLLTIGLLLVGVFYFNISWKIAYLCSINIATFILYAYDKKAAKNEWGRIPEMVLHLFELLGGSVFAFIAQQVLRHKNRKLSFQVVFWIIVIVQIASVWKFWDFIKF